MQNINFKITQKPNRKRREVRGTKGEEKLPRNIIKSGKRIDDKK